MAYLGRVRSLRRARPVRQRRRDQLVLPPVAVGEAKEGAAAAQEQRRRAERARELRQDVAPGAEVLRHAGHDQPAAGLQGGNTV